MSKSGKYYMDEIEKRDILINKLRNACTVAVDLIATDYPEIDKSSGEIIERGKPREVYNALCEAIGDASEEGN